MNGIRCVLAGQEAEVIGGTWYAADLRFERLLRDQEAINQAQAVKRHTVWTDDYAAAVRMVEVWGGQVVTAPRFRDPLPPGGID